MWYVIQTISGNEEKLRMLLRERLEHRYYSNCYAPIYESVRRRNGKSKIIMRRLFPGYLLIETDAPVEVNNALRQIPDFAVLLIADRNYGAKKIFIPLSGDDEAFLDSILKGGVMHVSYVHLDANNRIDRVVGPLESYRKYITKMEFRHRFATVEAEIFGKKRKIHFGLWGDNDPKIPWLEDCKQQRSGSKSSTFNKNLSPPYRGDVFQPGDKIIYPELYGDTIFEVHKFDPVKGIVHTSMEAFGSTVNVELYAEDVARA